jgi:hypothetical protein
MGKGFRVVVTYLTFVFVTTVGLPQMAEARLTRITAGPSTIIDLPAFGATGPYLKIAGTFQGESRRPRLS